MGLHYDETAVTESGPLHKAEAVNLLVRAGHDYQDAENILAAAAAPGMTGKPQPIGPHSVLFLHTTGRWYIEGPPPDRYEARCLRDIRDIAAGREAVMNISEEELARALNAMILSPEDFSLISTPVPRPVTVMTAAGQPVPPPVITAAGSPWQQAGPLRAVLITGGEAIARGAFQVVRSQREEAGRWVTGALYQDEFPPGNALPAVYRREEHGWWAYSCNERMPDGQVDTARFRRLVPEGDQAG
jgi:hypothetical protein